MRLYEKRRTTPCWWTRSNWKWNKVEAKKKNQLRWTEQHKNCKLTMIELKRIGNATDDDPRRRRKKKKPAKRQKKTLTNSTELIRERKRNMFVERPLPTLLYAIRYTIFVVHFLLLRLLFVYFIYNLVLLSFNATMLQYTHRATNILFVWRN